MKQKLRAGLAAAVANVLALGAFCAANCTVSLASPTPVYTYHYNNVRRGTNTTETILTPANVNVNKFGKLFSLHVDSAMYAQPLYVPNLAIPGRGTHNVVYVATQHNSVYAFDADNGTKLWSVNLGPYQINPQGCTAAGDVGITGTPVINPFTNTIFVVAATQRGTTLGQELNALDLRTGARRQPSPVTITASVPGTGYGSVGGALTFNPVTEFQRPALLLDNGVLYIGFSARCDFKAYSAKGHGWLFAYNPPTLRRKSWFVVTPNGFGGGIWASGGGPAADANHNIYLSTGDGTFDAEQGGKDYGDSVIKLSPGNLRLLDYFTPLNQAMLVAHAEDLGSGGTLLLPNQSTSPPHLLVTAGKQGVIYLINRDNLGQYSMDDVVELNMNILGLYSTPTYWNGHLYFAGSGFRGNDSPKVFSFSKGRMSTSPTSQATLKYPYPGAIPVVSSNGGTNDILWVLQYGGRASGNEVVLHAYDATNLTKELYNSEQAGTRDQAGRAGKHFVSIIVSNGKVYVPTAQPQLSVFGLLPKN